MNDVIEIETTSAPAGYMEDSKGRLVPEKFVKGQHLLEDQTVRKIIGFADQLSDELRRFKEHTFDDIATLMDLLRDKYQVTKGGQKGNISFVSYDGRLKVVVAVQDHINFGPELQVAKDLIDECLADWSKDAGDKIRAFVNHAFSVEKPGQVNREALFALRNLEIDDERWHRAVDAINDSIRVTGSKTYMRVYRRATADDKFEQIPLAIAAV